LLEVKHIWGQWRDPGLQHWLLLPYSCQILIRSWVTFCGSSTHSCVLPDLDYFVPGATATSFAKDFRFFGGSQTLWVLTTTLRELCILCDYLP
jgi:hypothetical protein